MHVYERSALEAYEKTEEVLHGMDEVFFKKALKPYSKGKTALAQAEELITLIDKKQKLIAFYYDIKEALGTLKPEHKRLLGEKYGFIGNGVTDEINRNYFRKILLATAKFAKAMQDKGYTPEKYEQTAKEFYFFDEILCAKKESEKRCKSIGTLRPVNEE